MEENKEQKEKCPEIPFFGATYPDGRCIDGYMYDLDSYENGFLTSGGESLCPFCNSETIIEELINDGEGTREGLIQQRNKFWDKHGYNGNR